MTEAVGPPDDKAIRGGSDCADPNGDLRLEIKRIVTDSICCATSVTRVIITCFRLKLKGGGGDLTQLLPDKSSCCQRKILAEYC